MKNYIGVAVSVGVLAGIWTQLSVELGLITWVGFVAWACFFAAGGGATGFVRALAALVTGVVYGWLVSMLLTYAPFPGALAVGIAVVAAAMCLQAGWAPLSFIPGAFLGTAVFFGTNLALTPTIVALVAGAGLGWLSGILGAMIQQQVTPAPADSPTVAAT